VGSVNRVEMDVWRIQGFITLIDYQEQDGCNNYKIGPSKHGLDILFAMYCFVVGGIIIPVIGIIVSAIISICV